MTGIDTVRRYVIAGVFDGLEPGVEFDRKHWPAHVTLVSNFVTDAPARTLAAAMRRIVSNERPLRIELGEREMFGPDRDVPVRLVRSESLADLHERSIAELRAVAVITADEPRYWHAAYRPHVTLVPSVASSGDVLTESREIVLARLDAGRATIVDNARTRATSGAH